MEGREGGGKREMGDRRHVGYKQVALGESERQGSYRHTLSPNTPLFTYTHTTHLTCRKLGLLETQYTLTVESKCSPCEAHGGTTRPSGLRVKEGSVAGSGQERLWANGTRDKLPILPPPASTN